VASTAPLLLSVDGAFDCENEVSLLVFQFYNSSVCTYLHAKKGTETNYLPTTYFDGYSLASSQVQYLLYSTLQHCQPLDKKKRMAMTRRSTHGEKMTSGERQSVYAVHQPNPGDGRRIGHATPRPSRRLPSHRRPCSPIIITPTSDIESCHLREEQGASMHRLPRSRGMDVRIVRRRATRVGVAPSPLASHHSAFAGVLIFGGISGGNAA